MIHFADAFVLYATPLLLAGLVILFIVLSRIRKRRLREFMEEKFFDHLIDRNTFRLQKIKTVLLVAAVALSLLALARPQWGEKRQNMVSRGLDIIVAVDTSTSMLAEDFKPNRLEKAKHSLSSFIDLLRGDRIGVITFAGTSFLSCPLTLDYDAAKMYLDIIDEYSIPVQGTAIANAVQLSIKAFEQGEDKHKVLLMITDGEDHEGNPEEAAKEAKKNGIIIYTLGIGSAAGEPIPLRDENGTVTGYKKDRSGHVVTSKLDDTTLAKIAQITGGKYYHATDNELELDRIYDDIQHMEKKDLKSALLNRFEDRFEWFFLAAFILFLLEMLIPEVSWKFEFRIPAWLRNVKFRGKVK